MNKPYFKGAIVLPLFLLFYLIFCGIVSSGHDKPEPHQCGMESRLEREHRRLESRMESDQGKIQDLKKENVDLKEQNRTLAAQNQILQEKILSIEKELGQNQSQRQKQERSRQTHRDIGEELEL